MTVKIEKKIIGYKLKAEEEIKAAAPAKLPDLIPRPDILRGTTYKMKTPALESAMYITINDMEVGDGVFRPFEIFINSKNMEHFQWIVALTRVMSAVFRKGGDVTFLVEELSSVFEPSGGYFKKGGKFMPSIVAEIGDILKQYLTLLGAIQPESIPEATKKIIEEKAAEAKANGIQKLTCPKCNEKGLIKTGGCDLCELCSYSKCS